MCTTQRIRLTFNFFALVAVFVMMQSCKPSTAAPSKSEILVKTTWTVQSTIPFIDEILGTVFIFAKDGSFQQVASDGNVAAVGRWKLENGETSVVVTVGSGSPSETLTFDVLELTDTLFRFRYKHQNTVIVEFRCVPVK